MQACASLLTTIAVLFLLFQCTPIQYFWNPQLLEGRCIKRNAFYTTGRVLTMIMVTGLFFLPLPLIWKLQHSTFRKWALSVVFAIGGL